MPLAELLKIAKSLVLLNRGSTAVAKPFQRFANGKATIETKTKNKILPSPNPLPAGKGTTAAAEGDFFGDLESPPRLALAAVSPLLQNTLRPRRSGPFSCPGV
jgi:hypothetical protein